MSAARAAAAKPHRGKPAQSAAPGTAHGYSGTPLAKKLGIRAGGIVALASAPRGFEYLLEPLPEGARTTRGQATGAPVVLLFAKTQSELKQRFPAASKRVASSGRLWVCWPKQGGAAAKDLNGNDVRAFGLARGWVDFKVCAVDSTWSALCFSLRTGRA